MTLWHIIKDIIDYILGRKHKQEAEDKANYDKKLDELNKGYQKIEKAKENKKDDSIDKRLKNMF